MINEANTIQSLCLMQREMVKEVKRLCRKAFMIKNISFKNDIFFSCKVFMTLLKDLNISFVGFDATTPFQQNYRLSTSNQVEAAQFVGK